ncbi:phosphoserine phosphatase [Aeropyrum pernix]|uniref:phosphoserine phosphatase n=1 Tax=Aeropyrum pernix TaxID=56636 RepID=A0A401HBC0_AERPX|nr:HAD-IB family phosphatase [Aeropyrum pernix]GBF09746.1 phosphoserine phosphatase [Aeropyrum pernix]
MARGIKLVIFDVDGVLVEVKSSWGYIHRRLGVEEEAMKVKEMFERGSIDYIEWMRLDTELWIRASGGRLHRSRLMEIVGEIPLRREAFTAVRILRRMGLRIGLVSSGIDLLVRRVAAEIGADAWASNRLLFDKNGFLLPGGSPLVGVDKRGAVTRMAYELGASLEEVAYVGDSRWDASAMSIVGLPIAYNDGGELDGVAKARVDSLLEVPRVVAEWGRVRAR